MIHVVIADDHTLFRQGLAQLLRGSRLVTIAGEASTGEELQTLLATKQPQVALVDLSMPGPSVLELPAWLAARELPTRLLALTMHAEPGMVRRVLQAGFRGYVLKENAFSELLNALTYVAAGKEFLSAGLAAQIVQLPAPVVLSDREQSVLRGIAQGWTNKRIANELGISVKTVDTYRSRLMAKLNVHSSPEMVRVALEAGLL